MPSLNESIYSIFTKIFTNLIYQNVKKNTEWKRKYLFYGHSTVSKVEFDNYLSILFMMFINGAKGSAENNWSKDPSYRHQFITSIGMDYKQWQEVNRCINFGESSSQQDFDDDIQLHGDNIQLESDSEPEPDNEYAMTEEEIIEKNLKRERKEYEILEKNNKVKQMRESVEKVQSFLKILQDQFQRYIINTKIYFAGVIQLLMSNLLSFLVVSSFLNSIQVNLLKEEYQSELVQIVLLILFYRWTYTQVPLPKELLMLSQQSINFQVLKFQTIHTNYFVIIGIQLQVQQIKQLKITCSMLVYLK
ncbi:Hypothetical_protein [Hexamita inflata]|uniref:Hypothetical_protein n=1 Tax=Hexamita inflata TaxID=28002 RepID=A0ABP1HF73_9EUKA